MTQSLMLPQTLVVEGTEIPCHVGALLGTGSQGEVYQATIEGEAEPVALKWYYTSYLLLDLGLRNRLLRLINDRDKSKHDRFVWPQKLITRADRSGLGFVMPIYGSQYRPVGALLNGAPDVTLRVVTRAGYELVNAFLTLAAAGYCYRDINYENVLVNYDTGEVKICDTDNIDVDGAPGPVAGTPLFMAPELLLKKSPPRTQTDLHALAVLLFVLLHSHHPFYGRRVLQFAGFDQKEVYELCGHKPTFIFDPVDTSNAPDPKEPEAGANAIPVWRALPKPVQELFTRTFTEGLKDPLHGRARFSEWRPQMVQLHDLVMSCPDCKMETFLNIDRTAVSECTYCRRPEPPPLQLHLRRPNRIPSVHVLPLVPGTRILQHHLKPTNDYDFTAVRGAVTDVDPVQGTAEVHNRSKGKWVVQSPLGQLRDVPPGAKTKVDHGSVIFFGEGQGRVVHP